MSRITSEMTEKYFRSQPSHRRQPLIYNLEEIGLEHWVGKKVFHNFKKYIKGETNG